MDAPLKAMCPRQLQGVMILVTQTSGQKTRIPGLGGAVGNMHLGRAYTPDDTWIGLMASMAAELLLLGPWDGCPLHGGSISLLCH